MDRRHLCHWWLRFHRLIKISAARRSKMEGRIWEYCLRHTKLAHHRLLILTRIKQIPQIAAKCVGRGGRLVLRVSACTRSLRLPQLDLLKHDFAQGDRECRHLADVEDSARAPLVQQS